MTCQNCNFTFNSLSPQRSADLQARLRSNQTHVAPAEAGKIAELSADVRADIYRCDTEISRLHALIVSLENSRRQLKSLSNAYISLTAPVRILPPEILTQIFSYHCGKNSIAPRATPDLLILANVCAYWRNLIISNATLWSRITMSEQCTPSALKVLDHFLLRSGQLPLTLEVKVEAQEMEVMTMDTLVRHSHRWCDLDVLLGDPDAQNKLWEALHGDLPLLERLAIYVEDGEGAVFQADHVFESLPRLHTLSLECQIAGIGFPWTQIIHLTLAGHDIDEVLRILSLCPRVETVKLDYCQEVIPNEEREIRDDYRVLPNLRVISITIGFTDDLSFVSAIFRRTTCPFLHTISIELSDLFTVSKERKWPGSEFSSFLSRSACNITALSLVRLPCPDLDLVALMVLLPSLVYLYVEEMCASAQHRLRLQHDFLQSLLPANSFDFNSCSSLVPNLRSVSFVTDGSAIADQCFVDMVKSRWCPSARISLSTGTSVASLRSVVLRVTGRAIDWQTVQPLRHLERAGMQVSIFDSAGRVV